MNRLKYVGLAVLLLAGCGVSKEKYASLEDQLNSTKAEKDACNDKLTEVGAKSQELEKKTQTYENLVGSLQQEIKDGKVKISEMNNRLTVNLIDKIMFDSGSTMIQEEGKAALSKIADVVKSVEGKRIEVEGHTDNVGLSAGLQKKFATNWELSTARAIQVVKFLAQSGVPEEKLSAAGYSMFMPVASNDTPEGKKQNRRIEIVLVPEVKPQTAQ